MMFLTSLTKCSCKLYVEPEGARKGLQGFHDYMARIKYDVSGVAAAAEWTESVPLTNFVILCYSLVLV